MGDRGNVVIYQDTEQLDPLFFYSHWGGSSLLNDVKQAIAGHSGRWQDESYLARIIFEGITARYRKRDDTALGDVTALDPALGFGIGTRLTDNSHALVVVDIPAQRIRVIPELSNEHDWRESSPSLEALPALEIGGTDFADC